MLLYLMNQDVKIQPTRHEEYVIQQSMVKKIKINLKRLESDMELMELVFKELIVIQQYISIKKIIPTTSS